MKPLKINSARTALSRVVATLIFGLLLGGVPAGIFAQSVRITRGAMPDMPPSMPMPPSGGDSSPKPDSGKGGPWIPSDPLTSTNSSGTNADDIQLSFQGANIDMVVQWLAQTTGKTIVKHPQVQCQLTITSSKKVSPREALNIVYRALALEGFTAIETSQSILIVPEGKEPRMSPEVVDSSRKDIPEGRQRLTKVFSLTHVQAASLKDKVQAALSDKATVMLDEHANQIIITDYNDNLRVVGELIDALDTDRPEDVAVRIIGLKHMSAQDLAKELAPLYQKMNNKGGGSAIDVAADDRSNSLIILSSEADFNALQRIISGLDTSDAQEKIMKTFLLKNADAQDVAKQLQDLGQNQDNNNRYPYYIFSSDSSSNSKAGKKMSVVADRRRNAVIVQAPPAEMDGVAKMIDELDEPVPDEGLAPKIFHLKYASAVDIEDVLNELFLKKQENRSYWDYYYGDSDDSSSGSSSQDAGRLYGKVRITSEPYSNTILVTSNSKENLAVVEDVLSQLDSPSEAGESTLHVPLMFAKASVVARNINILFAKNGSPPFRPSTQQPQNNNNNGNQQPQQGQTDSAQNAFQLAQDIKEEGYYPWIGGQPDSSRGNGGRSSPRPVSDLIDRVRAVADERGNALLISANVHYFPQVLKLINELDAPSDQVLIEARIVEVSSDYMDKLGVRWSPDGSKVFTADDYDNSFLAHGSGTYQKGFGGNTIVNNTAGAVASGLTPSSLLAQMRSGVVQSSVNIDFLVQFLRKTTDATVLGEPQININDNETGRLFVGQQVPILTGQNNPAIGGNSQNFTYKDVGVILEVTPHINSNGDVELKVHAESSTVVAGDVVFGSSVFDTRNFQTDLTAKNGETLVLGGIHQRQISDTLRKTPILGSIPGLGWAFKKKDKTTQDVELMVFLHPRVVHDQKGAAQLMEEINQKMPKMKKWDEDSASKMAPGKPDAPHD